MPLRNAVKTLLVLVLALPLVAAVLVWVVGLLRAMGDAAGAAVVGYVGTACQIIWLGEPCRTAGDAGDRGPCRETG